MRTLEEYRKTCKPYYEVLFRAPSSIPQLRGPAFFIERVRPGGLFADRGERARGCGVCGAHICGGERSPTGRGVCVKPPRESTALDGGGYLNPVPSRASPAWIPFPMPMVLIARDTASLEGGCRWAELIPVRVVGMVGLDGKRAKTKGIWKTWWGGSPWFESRLGGGGGVIVTTVSIARKVGGWAMRAGQPLMTGRWRLRKDAGGAGFGWFSRPSP